jgi:hypothetical protein
MKKNTSERSKLPGQLAMGLMIGVTALWTFWGVAEMYYEGWWGSWLNRLPYLIPGTVTLFLALLAIRWPSAGGVIVIVVGAGFTAWWWGMAAVRRELTVGRVLVQAPLSALLMVIGVLFVFEGRRRKELIAHRQMPELTRERNRWLMVAVAIPSLIALGLTVYWAPTLLARVDDGYRGARRIQGNGVSLVWAPSGPGWNWQQSWGGYPSWDSLAWYGVPPVGLDKPTKPAGHATAEDMMATGLCRFLSDDGLELMAEPQDVWRMPTTDEVIGSLVRHGESAGCTWDGTSDRATCVITPDKETPLWAPDQYPIYYWTGDEFSADEAYFVSYRGRVGQQPKDWGNPRHGYRCVRR